MHIMDASSCFASTQLSVPSLCGTHIATLNGSRIEIRSVADLAIVRSIDLPSNRQARFLCIRWSPVPEGITGPTRFLLSDEDVVRVWDLEDSQWSATVDNGSGGMGKIAHVEFGADDAEVIVFSSFGARVSVWSLRTGRRVEMKDPKCSTTGYGWNHQSHNGTFALLTRPVAQDQVTLHTPGSYATIKSFTLPTVDAQGLKWSPEGRWMAIWDTPSTGYKIRIYTADGNLYRTYSGDYYDDTLIGLGVKSIEWSPNGDFLAVGGYENRVTLLSTRTFSPAVYLAHCHTIRPSSSQIWQEQVTSSGRSYSSVMQSISPPSAPAVPGESTPQVGISNMKFNADGTLLATKDDSIPTAVWIWDLRRMQRRVVLIQHAIVKRLLWHPTDPDSLLIQCAQDENVLYLWHALADPPQILDTSSAKLSGKLEARWIRTEPQRKPIVMVGNTHGFCLAYPQGQEPVSSPVFDIDVAHAGSEDSFLNLTSEDIPNANDTGFFTGMDSVTANGTLDDTFQHRKVVDVR